MNIKQLESQVSALLDKCEEDQITRVVELVLDKCDISQTRAIIEKAEENLELKQTAKEEAIGTDLENRIKAEDIDPEHLLARLSKDMTAEQILKALPQLAGLSQVKGTKRTVPMKYRNTEAPHEEWSGRGHAPPWMEAAIERAMKAGKSKDEAKKAYLIKPEVQGPVAA